MMFNRVKNVFYNVVGGTLEAVPSIRDGELPSDRLPLKFRYTRPHFLQLTTDDEVQVSADHIIRPIIVPRDITKLPWHSGYAEAINAGKSARNEDQAAFCRGVLRRPHASGSHPAEDKQNAEQQAHLNSPTAISTNKLLSTSPSENTGHGESEHVAVPAVNGPSVPDDAESVQSSMGDSSFATPPSTPELPRKKVQIEPTLPWIYFGMFDGHAGSGAAVAAANTLHNIIQEKLQSIVDHLIPTGSGNEDVKEVGISPYSFCPVQVSTDSLIIGALETAFWDMDNLIARDKLKYKMTGGCTALAAVFICGKLYLANAGDSRAIVCRGSKVSPLSMDFTPETEKDRIRQLGLLRPELLGGEFTQAEFVRRPVRRDIGKRLLYRDAYMTGWAYKTITVDDLKFPLIYGEGKRSRVLATIGVTRGFGDHDLKAQNSDIGIKPFLTAQPEVKVFDLTSEEMTDSDVLVMGTDGLWDITTNDKAAEIVQKALDHFPASDMQRHKYRYISAAQDLVMHSRGKLRERNWKTVDNKPATIDDISVFVIPLKNYQVEYFAWKAEQEALSVTLPQATINSHK